MTDTFIARQQSLTTRNPLCPFQTKRAWIILSEEKTYQKPQPARLVRISEIATDTPSPVRILGIVVDSVSGISLVQDLYVEANDAGKIWVSSEKELEVEKKYLLVGNLMQETVDGEKRMRLDATISLNIDDLDIDIYREAVEMEESVVDAVRS